MMSKNETEIIEISLGFVSTFLIRSEGGVVLVDTAILRSSTRSSLGST